MFNFRPVQTDPASLLRYVDLFKACFPKATHLHFEYLRWLYEQNPCGRAIGIDAMAGEVLAAHYVCVPADIWLYGKKEKALLSLNTATHPLFQGRGLFTQLAERTYALGCSLGATTVFGVANANSTPGFVRKLRFQLVAPLDARLSIGRPLIPNWERVESESQFRRAWTIEQLRWRMRSPANPLSLARNEKNGSALFAKTGHKGIVAWGESPLGMGEDGITPPSAFSPRLFLGLYPHGTCRYNLSLRIPNRFRPSPLNLIFRDLNSGESSLSPDQISFNFFDFDAY